MVHSYKFSKDNTKIKLFFNLLLGVKTLYFKPFSTLPTSVASRTLFFVGHATQQWPNRGKGENNCSTQVTSDKLANWTVA